ncbi:MAG: group II intron reverse transcriptase/maturase, partial [Actinobacteria bacterium]|nr:group II intron reverse transcriptase/maturase [Actinomycetota bacterium]
AGNIKSLFKVYEKAIWCWRRMLSSRSSKSYITWDKFHKIKALFPLLRPKLAIPYEKLKVYAML